MANDDSISQEEIDNLMAGLDGEGGEGDAAGGGAVSAAQSAPASENLLSRADQSTILEVHNIAFGAAASTLSVLLGQEVSLAPLRLTEYDNIHNIPEPFDGEAKYLVGLHYKGHAEISSAMVFRARELKTLATQMMAAVMPDAPPAEPSDGDTLSDMELDAAKEALNQFFQTSATSISSILSSTISVDITPLAPYSIDQVMGAIAGKPTEKVISVDYLLEWADTPQLSLCQIMPTATSRLMIQEMMQLEPEEKSQTAPAPQPKGPQNPQPAMTGQGGYTNPMAAQQPFPGGGNPAMQNPVTVQPVQFQPLDGQPSYYGEMNKNLELVMDVTLSLTVELGKTEISIKEVLELTRGSVIELDRVAGEPVDLLANGKLIAKGEVVVIEDNFGLRITSIVSPADRLRGL